VRPRARIPPMDVPPTTSKISCTYLFVSVGKIDIFLKRNFFKKVKKRDSFLSYTNKYIE